MKLISFAAVALSLVGACTDTSMLEASRTEAMAQAEAAALCDLPARDAIAELLGDCVATSFGWQCTPCAVGSCAAMKVTAL